MSGQSPYNQPPHYGADSQNPYSNPWDSENQNPPQSYNPPTHPQNQPHFPGQGQAQSHIPYAQIQDHSPFHAQEQSHVPPSQQYEAPPGLPPRRTDTERVLPQGEDRSHQVEVMQSYEMSRSRPQTEDEQNQAILQREFPNIDGSLIAAIYGDNGNLGATREMLQELSRGEGNP